MTTNRDEIGANATRVAMLARAVRLASNDDPHAEALIALATTLAAHLDDDPGKETAAVAREYRAVLAELAQLRTGTGDDPDATINGRGS